MIETALRVLCRRAGLRLEVARGERDRWRLGAKYGVFRGLQCVYVDDDVPGLQWWLERQQPVRVPAKRVDARRRAA